VKEEELSYNPVTSDWVRLNCIDALKYLWWQTTLQDFSMKFLKRFWTHYWFWYFLKISIIYLINH